MLPALLTLGAGIAGAYGQHQTAKNQQEAQEQAIREYNATMNRNIADYSQQQLANLALYESNADKYLNSPDKIQAWLNPNMDYQREQINLANNQQYASGGKMLAGSAMKGLQDRQQNQAKLSFNEAFNMMNASNNQGLNVLGNLTGMRNDLQGNLFNAQEGMSANNLNAQMGIRKAGFGDMLQGFGAGATAFGNVANAFRSSPSTGTPSTVKTAGV